MPARFYFLWPHPSDGEYFKRGHSLPSDARTDGPAFLGFLQHNMARWPGCRVSVGKTRFVLGYRTARNPGFLQFSTFQLEAQHPMVGGKGNRGDLPRVGGGGGCLPVALTLHAV